MTVVPEQETTEEHGPVDEGDGGIEASGAPVPDEMAETAAHEEPAEPETAGDLEDALSQSDNSSLPSDIDMEHLFDSWDPYHADRRKQKLTETPIVGDLYQRHITSESYGKKQARTSFERKDRQFKICVAIIFAFVCVIAFVSSSFFTEAKKTSDFQDSIISEKAQEDLDNIKTPASTTSVAPTSLQNRKETLAVTVTAPEDVRETQAELVVRGTSATGEEVDRIFHVPLNEPKEISMTQGVYSLYFTYDLHDRKGYTYSCHQVAEVTLDESGKELAFEYARN